MKKIWFFIHKKALLLYFFLDLNEGYTRKRQEGPPALERGHPTLQNMKFLQFFLFCDNRDLLWKDQSVKLVGDD
jgi:hypothetical protein